MFDRFVENTVRLAELEDGGDDDLADILPQQLLQLLAGFGLFQIRDVGGSKCAGDLGIEVNTVHHDQHGRILQFGMQAQFLGGKDHQ